MKTNSETVRIISYAVTNRKNFYPLFVTVPARGTADGRAVREFMPRDDVFAARLIFRHSNMIK